jgi:hypothetical protein
MECYGLDWSMHKLTALVALFARNLGHNDPNQTRTWGSRLENILGRKKIVEGQLFSLEKGIFVSPLVMNNLQVVRVS